MIRKVLPLFIIPVLFLTACSGNSSRLPEIAVSILPQKYIVDRITDKTIPVMVMIPPGHSPATYGPTSRQIRSLAECRLYLRIGHLPFEKSQISRLASVNRQMKVIDTSKGVRFITSQHKNHDSHGHGTEADPHIWLSPAAMKQVAANCLAALKAEKPDRGEVYQKNYTSLIRDIESLEQKITRDMAPFRGKAFMVFHPAWNYFARDFHLRQIPIEFEGKEPGPAHIRRVIDMAKMHRIDYIFIQKQFPRHAAEAIARDIGGKVVQLDPLAEEWLANMDQIADNLKRELKD